MREVEELIYKRIVADNASGGVLSLLGEPLPLTGAPTRFLHAYQIKDPPSPGLVYSILSSGKGHIPRQVRDVFVSFEIYSEVYETIGFRLMRLFDGIQHNLSIISGGATQVGGVSSVFDFEGPDGFDEQLAVQKKDLRFRFFVTVKAQNPI